MLLSHYDQLTRTADPLQFVSISLYAMTDHMGSSHLVQTAGMYPGDQEEPAVFKAPRAFQPILCLYDQDPGPTENEAAILYLCSRKIIPYVKIWINEPCAATPFLLVNRKTKE